MKVFGNKTSIGNKAKNIAILEENNFKIPNTIIIELNNNKIDFNYLIKNLKENISYILRPSFDIEDGKTKSYAGFFKSLFPLTKKELINILKEGNLEKKFNGKGFILKSLIIQEFIDAKHYGVYFSRNPNNILKKGLYEIGNKNDQITSGEKINQNIKLNFLNKIELENIGTKLEKIFKNPQDIEFCINNNNIIILQTRYINTGNDTIYSFKEINKFNGVYKTLDFDELGDYQDNFCFDIFKNLFSCIYIGNKVYFKSCFLPKYLFKNVKTNNKDLDLFYKNYQKYLRKKIIFSIIKFLSFQKLDKNVIKDFFKNYNYNFALDKTNFLDLNFTYKTNFITNLFLKTEEIKNKSFIFLESYKKNHGNKINKKADYNLNLGEKLIIKNGIIINNINEIEKDFIWIYKGNIDGTITDSKNFLYKKIQNQILISENIDLDLYDKLDYLNGVIIKNGNSLSHNSIILREFKIPSIIKYKNYDNLKVGESFKLKIKK